MSEPVRTIHTKPEIKVFGIDDLSGEQRDLNVDVEVVDDAGRWSATFFTIANIETLLARYAETGECAGGTYLWASDMIVVRSLSDRVIIETVLDSRARGEFAGAFRRLDPPGEP